MTYSVEVINQRDLKLKLPRPQSQLHLTDDLLIVCTENAQRTRGLIYALDYTAKGMPERWLVPLPDGYSARFGAYYPQNNLLLLAVSNLHTTFRENSYLMAIDVATGNSHWRFPTSKYLLNLSAPIIIRDNVFVISNTKAFLLSVENMGQIVWSVDFSFSPHWLYNSIAIDESTIYVSVGRDGIVCLDQSSGEQKRLYPIQEGEIQLAAAIDDQLLIAGTSTGQLIAFDKKTTQKKWSMQVGREITTAPLIHLPLVFVSTKAYPDRYNKPSYQILAVQLTNGQPPPTGFQPFTLGSNSQFYAPLTLTADNLLLCGANDGNLYALDSRTGQKKWRHFMQSELFSSPVITSDGQIFVASQKGMINVLRLTSTDSPQLVESPTAEKTDRKTLLRFLRKHFDMSELKELCSFELDIDAEKFRVDTRDNFTMDLVNYCERHGRLEELDTKIKVMRPLVHWS